MSTRSSSTSTKVEEPKTETASPEGELRGSAEIQNESPLPSPDTENLITPPPSPPRSPPAHGTPARILLYLVRWDLRVADNAILYKLATADRGRFTHVMPVFVLNGRLLNLQGLLDAAAAAEVAAAGAKNENLPAAYQVPVTPVGSFPLVGARQLVFLMESVFNLRKNLEKLGCGLSIRAGRIEDVARDAIRTTAAREDGARVAAVWMARRMGELEAADEERVRALCRDEDVAFRLWENENTFVDREALNEEARAALRGMPSAFVQALGPLRQVPRKPLPAPAKDTLPAFAKAPAQARPFVVPAADTVAMPRAVVVMPRAVVAMTEDARKKAEDRAKARAEARAKARAKEAREALTTALVWPMEQFNMEQRNVMQTQIDGTVAALEADGARGRAAAVRAQQAQWQTARRPVGGETEGQRRLVALFSNDRKHLVAHFKTARRGVSSDRAYCSDSTFLSPYLVHGCISKRQLAEMLWQYEQGSDERLQRAVGFGGGENEGSRTLREWLAWNDFFALRFAEVGGAMFRLYGTQRPEVQHPRDVPAAASNGNGNGNDNGNDSFLGKNGQPLPRFVTSVAAHARDDQTPPPATVGRWLPRLMAGVTGMGLVDAATRQLLVTGFASQRLRRVVAMFWARHCAIDWRLGAAYLGSLQIDNDPVVNHGNWQYAVDVDDAQATGRRVLHPVQQATRYDPTAAYVRHWLPELAALAAHAARSAGRDNPCGPGLLGLQQPCTLPPQLLRQVGLLHHVGTVEPVRRMPFDLRQSQQRASKEARKEQRDRMLRALQRQEAVRQQARQRAQQQVQAEQQQQMQVQQQQQGQQQTQQLQVQDQQQDQQQQQQVLQQPQIQVQQQDQPQMQDQQQVQQQAPQQQQQQAQEQPSQQDQQQAQQAQQAQQQQQIQSPQQDQQQQQQDEEQAQQAQQQQQHAQEQPSQQAEQPQVQDQQPDQQQPQIQVQQLPQIQVQQQVQQQQQQLAVQVVVGWVPVDMLVRPTCPPQQSPGSSVVAAQEPSSVSAVLS